MNMYKQDSALNDPQGLSCHQKNPNQSNVCMYAYKHIWEWVCK